MPTCICFLWPRVFPGVCITEAGSPGNDGCLMIHNKLSLMNCSYLDFWWLLIVYAWVIHVDYMCQILKWTLDFPQSPVSEQCSVKVIIPLCYSQAQLMNYCRWKNMPTSFDALMHLMLLTIFSVYSPWYFLCSGLYIKERKTFWANC